MLLLWEAYALAAQTPRISGKRIAAYTIDDNGKLRKQIDALIEAERIQDEADAEIVAVLVACWRQR